MKPKTRTVERDFMSHYNAYLMVHENSSWMIFLHLVNAFLPAMPCYATIYATQKSILSVDNERQKQV